MRRNIIGITESECEPNLEGVYGGAFTGGKSKSGDGARNGGDAAIVTFDANADNHDYGNPTAGHTDTEIRPYSIYALPILAY